MNGSFLADPKVLTVIFATIGGAIAWLWRQVSSTMEEHRACELKLVRVEAEMTALRVELSKVQGTCGTLTDLLRKEVHIG